MSALHHQLRQKLRLYLVADTTLCGVDGLVDTVTRAVAGGVSFVQLRAKDATTPERVEMARDLKAALAGTGVPLLINDDVSAAIAADVDGAHIGQGDGAPAKARALLGPEKILGLSCETPQTVRAADPDIVDYLGLGPVFSTPTKADHKAPIGFDGLARMVQLTDLPCVAIGGLKAAHQPRVFAAGADGQAVVSAICGQDDPKAAAERFQHLKEVRP
ncbi:thiamine phosphate synthase [Loktanella sp. D2R18]|uniref:thiamine phosphate synthase n=1 Tax=Rhodobacterales TaxID=204455 RepID=UPI000DEB4069|nr:MULTISPECIES: thiamine phosphate synthase [Rhodobacterales]MDO6590159.1 thiamine phosphate synthase [Yoonia sp. 1_MG-2023]RBW43012.1 thiamine phosphate synthase [Loktanella sp. D2R18]